jgi:hypothetical protein
VGNLRLETGKFKLLTQGSRLSRLIVNQENGLFSLCPHPWKPFLIKEKSAKANILNHLIALAFCRF